MKICYHCLCISGGKTVEKLKERLWIFTVFVGNRSQSSNGLFWYLFSFPKHNSIFLLFYIVLYCFDFFTAFSLCKKIFYIHCCWRIKKTTTFKELYKIGKGDRFPFKGNWLCILRFLLYI